MCIWNREIVTCSEMKEIERLADEAGLSYLQMMENAGAEAFRAICRQEERLSELDAGSNAGHIDGRISKMIIFCGSGNNGGDGFVVARKATEAGIEAVVVLPCGQPKTPDAITNYELIKDKVRVIVPADGDDLTALADSDSPTALADSDSSTALADSDSPTTLADGSGAVLVDAIFGTGFHGEPRGVAKEAIRFMNSRQGVNRIYALDVPSGLPGDLSDDMSGRETEGSAGAAGFPDAVYADWVISFHALKPIHTNSDPGIREHMKRIQVADIGIVGAMEMSRQ